MKTKTLNFTLIRSTNEHNDESIETLNWLDRQHRMQKSFSQWISFPMNYRLVCDYRGKNVDAASYSPKTKQTNKTKKNYKMSK